MESKSKSNIFKINYILINIFNYLNKENNRHPISLYSVSGLISIRKINSKEDY